MRITYLHQYFNTPDMPGTSGPYEMARRLVARGHEVNMVTSWREPRDERSWFETRNDGIRVLWVPVTYSNHMPYAQRLRAFFRFAWKAAHKAAELPADLVFASSTPLTIALPGAYAARRLQVPMVFEVRDLWPELPIAVGALKNPVTRFLARRLERFAYDHAAAIVVMSPGMRDGVAKTGYPAEKIAVIPNAADHALFRVDPERVREFRARRGWLGSRPLLIYAGTFGLINGVGYMVDLARHLLEIAPEVRILLVGGGLEHEKVQRQAARAGVLNRNLFIEMKIPKNEIPAALNAADMAASLFVDFEEMQATSANKFFDALAARKPLMINYGGWHKELVESAGAGVVTWRRSPEAAAAVVAEAIRDRAWLQRAGQAAYKMGMDLFSREQLAAQLEQVLVRTQADAPESAAGIAPGDYRGYPGRAGSDHAMIGSEHETVV